MSDIVGIKGPRNTYDVLGKAGNQTGGPGSKDKNAFMQVLGDVLSETGQGLHNHEQKMKDYTLSGGDPTQLTFNTAEISSKVKIVADVVQKVTGAWNDLQKSTTI